MAGPSPDWLLALIKSDPKLRKISGLTALMAPDRILMRSDADLIQTPMLDPLENLLIDSDWRFSTRSVLAIAKQLETFDSVLHIGTPSLFGLDAQNNRRYSVLIDRNEIYLELFRHKGRGTVIAEDVLFYKDIDIKPNSYSAVIMDSPWYVRDILTWLRVALKYASNDAAIFTTMFPALVRPNAVQERRHIASALSANNFSTRRLGSVSYASPSFEMSVFSTFGLPPLHGWRVGEFWQLSIDGKSRRRAEEELAQELEQEPDSPTRWNRYQANGLSVGVRAEPAAQPNTDRFYHR
jgi:hypothetical protein